jgi:hypothetical protein
MCQLQSVALPSQLQPAMYTRKHHAILFAACICSCRLSSCRYGGSCNRMIDQTASKNIQSKTMLVMVHLQHALNKMTPAVAHQNGTSSSPPASSPHPQAAEQSDAEDWAINGAGRLFPRYHLAYWMGLKADAAPDFYWLDPGRPGSSKYSHWGKQVRGVGACTLAWD